jgi:toxin ParE1/3/4
MRRLEVTFRPEAVADLQEIYRFIFEVSQSHVTATRFTERILARALRIGDAPQGGRPRDDLEPGLRTVPFETSAVIAYRVTATVDIINIFYGGRDYEALYRGHEPTADKTESGHE